jgi:hypothetical protein
MIGLAEIRAKAIKRRYEEKLQQSGQTVHDDHHEEDIHSHENEEINIHDGEKNSTSEDMNLVQKSEDVINIISKNAHDGITNEIQEFGEIPYIKSNTVESSLGKESSCSDFLVIDTNDVNGQQISGYCNESNLKCHIVNIIYIIIIVVRFKVG